MQIRCHNTGENLITRKDRPLHATASMDPVGLTDLYLQVFYAQDMPLIYSVDTSESPWHITS